MAEIGQLLRETRESKGLELEDVALATHIRLSYLDALEEEEFDELPAEVYVRGFLRNYAQFLGLDAGEILAMYALTRPAEYAEVAPNNRLPVDVPISVPLRTGRERWALRLLFVVVGILLGFGIWVGYRALFVDQPVNVPLADVAGFSSPTATETVTPIPAEVVAPAPSDTPAPTASQAPPVDPTDTPAATLASTSPAASPSTGSATVAPATATSTRTPEPTATATFGAMPVPTLGVTATIQVEVEITAESWLEVRVDDEPVFMGLLNSGDKQSWEARQRLSLRAGNAGGILVTVNGAAYGVLGESGEVKTVQWEPGPDGVPTSSVLPEPAFGTPAP